MSTISMDDAAVIWHDVECGAYGADLPLWSELAAAAPRGRGGADVLDLGAGTGRVALHLAWRGHRVLAIDNDELMVEAMRGRVAQSGAAVTPALGDAREFALDAPVGLVAAPMQLAQLLRPAERRSMFDSVAAALAPGGFVAVAVMSAAPDAWRAGTDGDAPRPDVRERDEWVFSSLPVAIERDGPDVIVHRLRQTVSPSGELREEEHVFRLFGVAAEELEAEAAGAGLRPLGRRDVPETDDFVGSTVVILGGAA